MPIPQFPSYALMLAEGYAEEANYGVQRTEMDGGLPKQRRRFSVPLVSRSLTVKLRSDADRLRFDAWLRDDLAGGVEWFSFPDPVSGQAKRGRLTGQPACRWQRDGPQKWKAQLQIETIG
ncbi:hypothetical protein [Chromobacterium violaceum]|uniref:hypothetical protein n=1 Tax=Chromobacterium violaceum TaxID=536 RepID=UPI001CE149F8|nr:hypothetical protein [Chromobacterium violaceum]